MKINWRLKPEKLVQLQKLQVGANEEQITQEYFIKYIKGFVFLFVCLVLGVISTFFANSSSVLNSSYEISKEDVLGKDRTVSIKADSKIGEKEVKIKVPHRLYNEQEKKKAFQDAEEYVKKHYLGKNTSAEKISKRLKLVTNIPNSAIQIKWDTGSQGFVNEDGTLKNDSLEQPQQVQIKAIFSYEDDSITRPFFLTIIPRKKSNTVIFWENWERELEKSIEKTKSDISLVLPETVLGRRIYYREIESNWVRYILGVFLLGVIILPALIESRIKEQIKKREEQLRLDYPEFVEQFVLLIGAGLTVKGAWERIVREYEQQKKELHYVYEEMKVSLREMENGLSERQAYEVFGRRIGQLSYRKFCTLMEQNLKKGSSDLLQILEYEMADAFEERKENAKIMGEKAGTKLLLPMGIMLVIVFALIMYAAFSQM